MSTHTLGPCSHRDVALDGLSPGRLCPWGLTGLRFGYAECHPWELLHCVLLPLLAASKPFAPRTVLLCDGCPCSMGHGCFREQAPPRRVMSAQAGQ